MRKKRRRTSPWPRPRGDEINRRGPKRHNYFTARRSYVIKHRLLAAGMTSWELADLLGVHEHQIDLEELPDLPVKVWLELARRLDINPADIIYGADELFELPRHREITDRRYKPTAHDALTLITALAHAAQPLTTDQLSGALTWSKPRIQRALDHAHEHPDVGGALVLRRIPPNGYTVTPRLDRLTHHQAEYLTGQCQPGGYREKGPIQPEEAEVLLRVYVDGGIDTTDISQAYALKGLFLAGMVKTGDLIDRFTDDVLYSLRLLREDPDADTNPH